MKVTPARVSNYDHILKYIYNAQHSIKSNQTFKEIKKCDQEKLREILVSRNRLTGDSANGTMRHGCA